MKKVLIISYFFPPVNCIASQRFGTMCKYFDQFGYQAYVLTTNTLSQTQMGVNLENYIPEHRIIKVGRFEYPYSSTSILTTILCKCIENNGLHTNTMLYSSIAWYEKVKRELDLSLLKDMDMIIGSFPPIGALLVAKYIADNIHCPYIADMRDAVTEYPDYLGSHKNCYILDSLVEKYIYKDASVIVSVGKEICNQLRQKYPKKKFEVVYNGWEEEHRSADKEKYTEGRYLYYAGTIYEQRFKCLKIIFQALKNIKKELDIRMYIRSTSEREMNMRIEDLIEKDGLVGRVILLKESNRDIVNTEQNKSYINVVLNMISADNEYMSSVVTGKIFENIQAEPPVLAISPPDSTISKILQWTEKGIATNSVTEVEKFILNPYGYEGKRKAIDFFSRKKQARIYCKIMDKVLEG